MATADKLVIGYDGSDQARDALVLGQLLAEHMGLGVLLAFVFHHELPSVAGWQEYEQGVRAGAEHALGEASSSLEGKLAPRLVRCPPHRIRAA